jgi:hypothetical protein
MAAASKALPPFLRLKYVCFVKNLIMNKTTPQPRAAQKPKQPYQVSINNMQISVFFSQSPTAPTLENALANIAIRKTD